VVRGGSSLSVFQSVVWFSREQVAFSCNYVFFRLERGGEVWQWRRRLWVWEEELVAECRILLANVTL